MSKIIQGAYTLQTQSKNQNSYKGKGGTLTLHKRKESTALKPALYLLYKPLSAGTAEYLSSLYPQPDGSYMAENRGIYWKVTLDAEKLVFSQVSAPNRQSAYEYQ